jgi:KipI family sensor histidine kinase inhibitor
MAAWTKLGDRAIRFARPDVSPKALIASVRAWPGVVDVALGADTVAAYYGDEPVVDEAAIAALGALGRDDDRPRTVTIKVVYDGDDLETVAKLTRLSAIEYARLHQGTEFSVETIGFLPGFAYLVGLPEPLHVPRRTTPSPRFPAGSLAVGAQYTGVYPFASPGGWHVIGRVVDGPMFGPNGARIAYGDRVRFDGGML